MDDLGRRRVGGVGSFGGQQRSHLWVICILVGLHPLDQTVAIPGAALNSPRRQRMDKRLAVHYLVNTEALLNYQSYGSASGAGSTAIPDTVSRPSADCPRFAFSHAVMLDKASQGAAQLLTERGSARPEAKVEAFIVLLAPQMRLLTSLRMFAGPQEWPNGLSLKIISHKSWVHWHRLYLKPISRGRMPSGGLIWAYPCALQCRRMRLRGAVSKPHGATVWRTWFSVLRNSASDLLFLSRYRRTNLAGSVR